MHGVPGKREGRAGQAMVELLVILPVLGFLILGAIQFALVFHAKITLNYAAWEAARAGSLNQARLDDVRRGLARGLAPLFSYSESDLKNDQVRAFEKTREEMEKLVTSDLVRIERLSPATKDFKRFGRPDRQQDRLLIPNDHLRYRSSNTRDGNQQNRVGSIQEANLLHLRVTYWHRLQIPVVNSFIRSVICCTNAAMKNSGLSCRWQDDIVCRDPTPRIPLTAIAAIRMQSEAESDPGYNCSNLLIPGGGAETASDCVSK